ncbi:DUF2062 domain-containing protein [Halosimplex salinum]|uniref:DUF2062 domain-containing protein n=1 Tax=Halosimplex salinum TaxID=1710538 RepID=UPI000F493BBB|nr:DUF2062 domain-containing protein [Halosimplex salinum]
MGTSRVAGHVERVRGSLRVAFSEDHPPRLVAVCFAVGIFLTALPNLGAVVPVFTWVGYRFQWASRLALLAAVVLLNPLTKGGVYVASFFVGVRVLGPIPGVTRADVGLHAGVDVLARLLLGNVILASGFAVVSYVVAYRTARRVRQRRH